MLPHYLIQIHYIALHTYICVFSVDWHLAGIWSDLYASLSCGCCLVNHATNNDLYVCTDCIYIYIYIYVYIYSLYSQHVESKVKQDYLYTFFFWVSSAVREFCMCLPFAYIRVLVLSATFCHANYNLCWSCWMWHVFTILRRMQLINFVCNYNLCNGKVLPYTRKCKLN